MQRIHAENSFHAARKKESCFPESSSVSKTQKSNLLGKGAFDQEVKITMASFRLTGIIAYQCIARDYSLLPKLTLAGSSDGPRHRVPAIYVGDVGRVPASQPQPSLGHRRNQSMEVPSL